MEGESEAPPSAAETVMEAGCAATATMAPNVNHDAAIPVTMVPVTKQMSDAAQFSYSAVCALTLRLLYSDDCHRLAFIAPSLISYKILLRLGA